ncbi:Hsp20/alpha crystallin family protein [Candidatus Formimonas warabiya]|uniref:Heat-shock protein Hsp20 n=1 Tax=Formimonas warabiya TaxID=1761012 RepID=A0A3G1KXB1_FORW1|nr:Hsp20/alpha crystallin family protein [Candidatus Formimonas warabiya]ATW26845.1 heat-shock protein Hsp20 [Candidatus Formimonas warabiya]
MALVPYDPFRHLENWRREMDRFFNEGRGYLEHNVTGPRVDVFETENEVVASCEIPGLEKKDDVQIEIHDNLLTITGNISRTNEFKEEQAFHRERYAGRFQRSIGLPVQVISDGTKASYKNGVLEIRMPKAKGDTRKRIDIDFH